MTKRYRERVEVVAESVRASPTSAGTNAEEGEPVAPAAFTWRGSTYRVLAVLGHWREDAGYWAGGGMEIPQRDLWRVEAHNGNSFMRARDTGVYELVCEQDIWRLDRIWD